MKDNWKQSAIKTAGNRIQIRYLIWQKPGSGNQEGITVGPYEIVPLFLQWDSRDEKVLETYKKWGHKNRIGKTVRKLATAYFQRRYRGVFLENTETLFLSEKAEKEIPDFLWKSKPKETWELYWSYAKETFWEILKEQELAGDGTDHSIQALTLVLAIPEESDLTIFEEWLEEVWERPQAQAVLSDFILLGSSQQKETGEEILDSFYEQTGIAGSFYDSLKQYKREMAERVYTDSRVKRRVLFLDCLGVPVKEIGRATFYIDGAGLKTKGEIRKMVSAGIICKSLYKHLDSTFLSKL